MWTSHGLNDNETQDCPPQQNERTMTWPVVKENKFRPLEDLYMADSKSKKSKASLFVVVYCNINVSDVPIAVAAQCTVGGSRVCCLVLYMKLH